MSGFLANIKSQAWECLYMNACGYGYHSFLIIEWNGEFVTRIGFLKIESRSEDDQFIRNVLFKERRRIRLV